MTSPGPPDPVGAHTAAEFVDRMSELRLWAGQPSLRTLNRIAGTTTSPTGATTDALPTTTVSWVLNGKGLPRPPRRSFVEAFVTACLTAAGRSTGEIGAALTRWRTAWHALAADAEARPVEARHQLPMDIPEFTGRQVELDRLQALAEAAGGTSPLVVTVTGMAGVGKTRLAVRAGHLLAAGRFDDVQLWADMRGFHPERPPATPDSVLENFLRLLGVAAPQLPPDLDARAALYRDRLTGRRALVVLDDAAGEEQVRPLLPGTPNCLVVITSRHSLTGLDGTHDLPLATFTPQESLVLLGRHAGHDRVHAEPDAARRLTDLCGHLPLAVAVTGRYLRGRPALSLDDLAARLAAGDPGLADLTPHARSVGAVFDLSCQALPAEHQRVFRLLAIHPGHDFAAESVAALAATPHAQSIVDDLLDEHLVYQTNEARYAVHDLVRQHMARLSRRDDTEGARQAALARLARHYLDRARHATLLLHPTEHRRVRPPAEPAPWDTPARAVSWVDAECDNIVATVRAIAESPDAELATALVTALYRPLANRGHSADLIGLNQLAVRVARSAGDRAAEAQSLEDLGTLCVQVGRTSEAVQHSHRALTIWTELGEPAGQHGCLTDLGNCCRLQGDHDKAIAYLSQALSISQESDDRIGEASVRNFLGLTYQGTGDFDTAVAHLSRSESLYEAAGNRLGLAIALANHGWALQRSGRPRTAVHYHRQSLDLFHTLADRYNEAEQHWGIAEALHQLSNVAEARPHWHAAITMLHEIHLLDDRQTAELLAQEVPETPELIRLNT